MAIVIIRCDKPEECADMLDAILHPNIEELNARIKKLREKNTALQQDLNDCLEGKLTVLQRSGACADLCESEKHAALLREHGESS